MVGILAAVLTDELDGVEAAFADALAGTAISRDAVPNLLTAASGGKARPHSQPALAAPLCHPL